MILFASWEGGSGCLVGSGLDGQVKVGQRQRTENQHRAPALQGKKVGAWSRWRQQGRMGQTHSGYTEASSQGSWPWRDRGDGDVEMEIPVDWGPWGQADQGFDLGQVPFEKSDIEKTVVCECRSGGEKWGVS